MIKALSCFGQCGTIKTQLARPETAKKPIKRHITSVLSAYEIRRGCKQSAAGDSHFRAGLAAAHWLEHRPLPAGAQPGRGIADYRLSLQLPDHRAGLRTWADVSAGALAS